MRERKRFGVSLRRSTIWVCLAMTLACAGRQALGQAMATAQQRSDVSVFGGLNGTYTELNRGKTLGITAGGDVSLWDYHGFHPALEVRGTYPLILGREVREKDFLGGIRVSRRVGPFNVYGDYLFGRGEIKYLGVFVVGPYQYLSTDTNINSPGAGVELMVTHHLGMKADGQWQRWGTPAIASGSTWEKSGTVAIIYKFDFNRHPKRR